MGTEEVLRALAARVAELDEGSLQREISERQLELQEIHRQIQERQWVLQVKQAQAQRAQERLQGVQQPTLFASQTSDLSKQLKQIRELASSIDDQALHRDMAELQARVNELNRQSQERQFALQLLQMERQREQQRDSAPGVGAALVVGNPSWLGQPSGGTSAAVDTDTKRTLILEALKGQPTRLWKPAQVRKALVERGIPDPDAGTPIRNLMWRMAKEGTIARPRDGLYAVASAEVAREPDEQRSSGETRSVA